MAIRNIYFFDLNEVLLDRYPARIANCLNEASEEDLNFVFLYTEVYNENEPNPKNLPSNSVVIFDKNFSPKRLKEIVRQFPPTAYISIGLRLPDIFLQGFFNNQGVQTYMVQHGIFVKHLTRIPLTQLVITKARKFLQYFVYANRISRLVKEPFFKTLKELYLFYFKETTTLVELEVLTKEKLISKKAFLFDESWNDYYESKYGYSKESFFYFGNPDYGLVREYKDKPVEDAVCYICQSLVEDGRYDKKMYLNFLKEMKEVFSGVKVYLKLHPRSRLSLYDSLLDEDFILTNDFKNCATYLGHYSSLLEISDQLGRNIILWQLEGHPVPDSYLKYGDLISSDWEEVKEFITNQRKDFVLKQGMIDFFASRTGPFEKIANCILTDLG